MTFGDELRAGLSPLPLFSPSKVSTDLREDLRRMRADGGTVRSDGRREWVKIGPPEALSPGLTDEEDW